MCGRREHGGDPPRPSLSLSGSAEERVGRQAGEGRSAACRIAAKYSRHAALTAGVCFPVRLPPVSIRIALERNWISGKSALHLLSPYCCRYFTLSLFPQAPPNASLPELAYPSVSESPFVSWSTYPVAGRLRLQGSSLHLFLQAQRCVTASFSHAREHPHHARI